VRVARWASRHARSIIFLLCVLVLGGVLGTLSLPVQLFPQTNFPRIRVNLEAGERPVEQMAIEVTRPVEESLRAIPGVRQIRSTTSRGAAEVWLTFDWGQEMSTALLQSESQINKVLPDLPQGTKFEARRMDPTVFATISYSLISDTRSLTELRDLAEYQLRPVLSTVTGVSKVDVTGGAIEEYRVEVDPDKLRAHGLTIGDVAGTLSTTNVLNAAGQIEDHHKLYLAVTNTRFKSIDEIEQTVLRSTGGGVVRLTQVATIRRDAQPRFTRATSDGHDAVLLDVYQQPDGNTVEIAKQIREKLEIEKKRLPEDVKISNWYDQSDLIVASAHSVRDAVLIGMGLAALVLLLFLRNWRITLVAAMTVPIVLAVTALVLSVLHQSLNIMTLGGMAAAVGLIIDDAIVMSEHIIRRLHGAREEKTGSPERKLGVAAPANPELPLGTSSKSDQPIGASDRVMDAADEFTKPLSGSSLSTIVIHIPPAFMIGVFGAFFAALSLSMATSLIISFLVAWLVIPVLAVKFLRAPKEVSKPDSPHGIHAIYRAVMRRLLPWPWLSLLILLPLLVGGSISYLKMPNELMPTMDEGGFILDYVAPPGASLTETDRLLRQVEAILRKTPEVQTYSRRTGFALGGDFSEPNTGDFFV
jgi:multidrug efflux pump subunit AcrB